MNDEERQFVALLKMVRPEDRAQVLLELKKIAESAQAIDEAMAGQYD